MLAKTKGLAGRQINLAVNQNTKKLLSKLSHFIPEYPTKITRAIAIKSICSKQTAERAISPPNEAVQVRDVIANV